MILQDFIRFYKMLYDFKDFIRFCNGEDQIGAPCDSDNDDTTMEFIQEDCSCAPEFDPIDCNPPHPDYESLMQLYNATNGANWSTNTGWIEGAAGESCNPCDWMGEPWFGINCDQTNAP